MRIDALYTEGHWGDHEECVLQALQPPPRTRGRRFLWDVEGVTYQLLRVRIFNLLENVTFQNGWTIFLSQPWVSSYGATPSGTRGTATRSPSRRHLMRFRSCLPDHRWRGARFVSSWALECLPLGCAAKALAHFCLLGSVVLLLYAVEILRIF